MAKPDKKGRSRDSRHIRLYTWLTNSPAWRHMSGTATKALIYLATWEDGSNNGELFMSARMLGEGIKVDKKTALRALGELERLGFIRAVERGHFQVKGGPATKWRLTWLSWPAKSRPPTHEYRDWKPAEKKSRGEKFPAAVGEIPQPDRIAFVTEGETPPDPDPKSQKSPNPAWGEMGTHSVATGEGSPEKAIRAQVASFWQAADPANRRALASRTGLRLDELRGYLDNGASLPFPKQVALRSAVRAMSDVA